MPTNPIGLHTTRADISVPILMVDDNPGKRLAMKAVLAPLGYTIIEADSGRAALRCLLKQDFAVILLDVLMPIMDGFETAALIRQRRQSEMTPIIFITAHGQDEIDRDNLYTAGAVDFIFAPVPPNELRAKVSVFANLFIKAEGLATQAREVQTSADQLRLLTEAAPIGIFQTDADGRYIYTNPCWSEITGVLGPDALGRRWESILDSEQIATLARESGALSVGRSEICQRFELHRPGTDSHTVLLTSKAISHADGNTPGWVGTLADVTAEVRAEAAMADARDRATEASQLKSDFLANMSHEIRTPMNGVLGMCELLLETQLDIHQRDYAQTVRDSGEALLTIIDGILDFSKLEAGKVLIEQIDFDVALIVRDVVDLLAASAQTKGIELIADVDVDLPSVVNGDPGRLRQVLTNLVGNAIKFSEDGEIIVRATMVKALAPEVIVRFEICDTGVGIAADKIDLIFQPFVQADTSTSRKYGGTGLGLAISAQLVGLMGGDCGVSSSPGVGSIFWFSICVRSEVELTTEDLFRPDIGLGGIPVLVASASAAMAGVLSDMMSHWGMAVTTVSSGLDARCSLRTARDEGQPFPVALLDHSIFGLSNPEQSDAILGETRFINMITAAQRARASDAQGPSDQLTLAKPIRPQNLQICLRMALCLQVGGADSGNSRFPSGSSLPQPGKGRILLAEDNLINRKVAIAMLVSAGYQVDTASDGAAAVRAAATQNYDVILMDCQMPELNGYEATKAIRVQEGFARHSPIIGLTAAAREEDKVRCLQEGMDAYLSKPFSKDALLGLVSQHIGSPRGDGALMASRLL